ncbi:MAG: DUF2059 domain-containing protein [Planctomycetaceae bacterium]
MRMFGAMCLLSLVAVCSADDAAPVEVTAERLKAAETLAATMDLKKQMLGGFDAMKPVIDQQAQQLRLSPEDRTEFAQIYRDWFEQDLDHAAMGQQFVELYAEEFTEEELVQLNEFYQTPLGQKLLAATPKLAQAGALVGMQEAQSKQGMLLKRMEPFLEKRRPR